jgi:hypothetical protein
MASGNSTSEMQTASADDESHQLEELRKIKLHRSSRDLRIGKAMQLLEEAASPRVRNSAALMLADLHASGAKQTLIDLVARPDTKGSRGTLLYSLSQLRASVPVELLVKIILEDSYEAREEALDLVSRGRAEGAAGDFTRAQGMLVGALATADEERGAAIRRALDYLGAKGG